MIILDLVIQFGKFFSEGGKSDTNWLDWFLKYFLTPFISFSVALFLYYLKKRDDKKKEDEVKRKSNLNDLKYFNTVIQDILKDLPNQIAGCEKYCADMKAKPFMPHQLEIVSSENLNRIVNKFDQQKIFHSYISHFKDVDIDKAIERFMELYNALDVYLILHKDIIFINDKTNEGIYSKLNGEYVEIFMKKLQPNMSKLISEVEHDNPELHKILNDVIQEYIKHTHPMPNTSQEFYVNKILQHNNLLKAYPLGIQILQDCHVMTGLYMNVISNSLYQHNIINVICGQLKVIHNKIKIITEANSNIK